MFGREFVDPSRFYAKTERETNLSEPYLRRILQKQKKSTTSNYAERIKRYDGDGLVDLYKNL